MPHGKLTGLFIGAGASCEVGMPLVWELTTELKKWLTPSKLRELNLIWRLQGGGHPDAVIDDLAAVLDLPDLHYESILGHLETQYRRASPMQQEYHGLYAWLVEMVYHILYVRHVKNMGYIERNLHYLEGVKKLAAENSPLWIFSLNHDVIIECLAARYDIPLSCGFTDAVISLPRRDKSGVNIGELRAETITAEQLEKSLAFFPHGSSGINLLKVHGALDVFTFQGGKDLLRLLPTEAGVAGVIGALRAANEELVFVDPRLPRPAKVTNEIAYADDDGEMQFLRRSLLAGAFKFDSRQSQVLPMVFLKHFRSYLNHVATLVCIGYGFGDAHINQAIRRWLEFSAERRLEIVGPEAKSVPASLLHLSPQIVLTASGATDYFDCAAGISRGRRDVLEKRLGTWIRRSDDQEQAREELRAFSEQYLETRMTRMAKRVAALPVRDGDIDLGALGVTPEELARRWFDESGGSFEDLLGAFLESRGARS